MTAAAQPQMPPESSQDLGLSGKVAIVTGGGAAGDGIGNGRAAAILLARAGARVLVVDRQLELAQRTVEMIAAEGGDAAAFAADVADEVQCRAMVQQAVARFRRLDNTASGLGSSASGGSSNAAIGANSSVSGGLSQRALGEYSSISGGHGCDEARTLGAATGGADTSVRVCKPQN
jgi:NAD(P)-dependent dehydrogenase (short-subunit alcohol dehydrogenase family)